MTKIKGELVIMKNGNVYVGKRKLKDDDEVYLPVRKLKQIIIDAKIGWI